MGATGIEDTGYNSYELILIIFTEKPVDDPIFMLCSLIMK
jgi:hypothetical protein